MITSRLDVSTRNGIDSRWDLGWLSPVATLTGTQSGTLTLHATSKTGEFYLVPSDTTRPLRDFFLVENRIRNSSSTSVFEHIDRCNPYPDSTNGSRCGICIPGSGIMITHVDSLGYNRDGNENAYQRAGKSVDIELADGLFDTTGGTWVLDRARPNPIYGFDHVDSTSSQLGAAAFRASDLLSQQTKNAFTPFSVPSSAAHRNSYSSTVRQDVSTGISIYNISPNAYAATFRFARADTSKGGHINKNMRWGNLTHLACDVVVDSLDTLQIVADSDNLTPRVLTRKSSVTVDGDLFNYSFGTDNKRVELIVKGTLIIDGTAANPDSGQAVKLSSAAALGTRNDWHGITLISNGNLSIKHGDIRDALYGVDSGIPGSLVLRRSQLHHNYYHGLHAHEDGGTFTIDSCRVYDNGYSGVYLGKKRTYGGSPAVVTELVADTLFENGQVVPGAEVELYDFGGTGTKRDNVRSCIIGGDSHAQGTWGVALSRADLSGGDQRGYVWNSAITNFSQNGLLLEDLGASEVTSSTLKSFAPNLSVNAATVTAESCLFISQDDTSVVPVNVESFNSSTTVLGDSTAGTGGCNFFQIGGGVCNWDGGVLKAELNRWPTDNCDPPDSSWFCGAVDFGPWLCSTCTGVGQGARRLPVGWSASRSLPTQFTLSAAAPNPFQPRTTIRYEVPAGEAAVSIRIYDVTGALIRTLVSERPQPGTRSVYWEGLDDHNHRVPAGVYFARMEAGTFKATTKLILVR